MSDSTSPDDPAEDTPASAPERALAAVQRVRDLAGAHRRTAMWISLAVFVVATALAVRGLPPIDGGIRWVPLVLVAAVLVPVGTAANAGEYAVTVAASGGRVPLVAALRVALMASAANLLPIPGAVLVRVQAMRNLGVPYRRAAGMTGVVGLGFVGVAVLCVGGLQLTSGDGNRDGAGLAGFGLVAVGVASLALVAWLLRTNARRGRVFGSLVLVELVSMTIKTLRLFAVLVALRSDAGLREASALALALVISLVVGVFPGGLGIREVLTGLLAPTVGLDPALGVVVAALDRVVGLTALAVLSGLFVLVSPAAPAGDGTADARGGTPPG